MLKKTFFMEKDTLLILALINVLALSLFFGSNTSARSQDDELLYNFENGEEKKLLEGNRFMRYSTFLQEQKRIEVLKDEAFRKMTAPMRTSFSNGIIGFAKVYLCDTCIQITKGPVSYYLTLNEYTLTNPWSFTYINEGKNYLRFRPLDKNRRLPEGHHVVETKEVPFFFSKHLLNDKLNEGEVLIPVSKSLYNGLYYPLLAFLWIGIVVMGYTVVVVPLKILIRISRGEVFTQLNIRQFHFMAVVFLFFSLGVAVLQQIMRLVFSAYLTEDVYVSFFRSISKQANFLIPAIVVLIVAKAFRKGLSLQKEQDLTI